MKKVISTALFGEGDLYAKYIGALVRGHLNVFPLAEDWRLHVFIDEDRHPTLMKMRDAGLVDVTIMGPSPLCWACLWRMIPAFDESVDYVFCRDIDAAVMPRDRACIEAFIASGLTVHNIHDHIQHVDMLGGLCGFKVKDFCEKMKLHSIDDLRREADALRWRPWEVKGVDQDVLNIFLLTSGGPDIFEHSYNGWFNGPAAFPARAPSTYAKVSKPTPDFGSKWHPQHPLLTDADKMTNASYSMVPTDLQGVDSADLLGAHLGCAHYDHGAATWFWDTYGDQKVAAAVAACEK